MRSWVGSAGAAAGALVLPHAAPAAGAAGPWQRTWAVGAPVAAQEARVGEGGPHQRHLHPPVYVRDDLAHRCSEAGRGRAARRRSCCRGAAAEADQAHNQQPAGPALAPPPRPTPPPRPPVRAHRPTARGCAAPSAPHTPGCAGPGPPMAQRARWRGSRRAGSACRAAPSTGLSLRQRGGGAGGRRESAAARAATGQRAGCGSIGFAVQHEPALQHHRECSAAAAGPKPTAGNGHKHHVLLRRHAPRAVPGVDHNVVQLQALQACSEGRQAGGRCGRAGQHGPWWPATWCFEKNAAAAEAACSPCCAHLWHQSPGAGA